MRPRERKARFRTSSGIEVRPVYGPEDLPPDLADRLGQPGQYPYTRGIYPTMYRSRLWTMRQYAGFGSAEETNARYRYLLARGSTGLSVAFDLPTQMGYDADHPQAAGEVGRVGVPISSLEDMERLFEGIPLDRVSTSMTINATAAILLALYVAVAEGQGVVRGGLRGTVQNDILKEYASRATYIFPPQPSMRLATDIIEFCARQMPQWNPISISGYHMREAGCTAAQEIGFTFANAISYVEAALGRGLAVDDFAPRLSFFFIAHSNLLEEVAKFRAARRLWARLMRERFGARNPRSWTLRFHTQTSGASLTAQQPRNNIVRVTLQALAAVLGGTQSLHTNAYDEALALPTEKSVQIALRTQQILAHETGVADTVDPLAGSFYVESMTKELEEQAQAIIEKIDDLGGSVRAIERGYIQRQIEEAAYRYQKAVESGEEIVVGVNAFQDEGQAAWPEIQRIDPEAEARAAERLARLRRERDGDAAGRALEALGEAARGEENLMPRILECVTASVTLGEICDVLRRHMGIHVPERAG